MSRERFDRYVETGALPEFCWWRDLVMWFSVGFLFLGGCVVGKAYFNRVMTEIHEDARRTP